jgi:hypothetical protein
MIAKIYSCSCVEEINLSEVENLMRNDAIIAFDAMTTFFKQIDTFLRELTSSYGYV